MRIHNRKGFSLIELMIVIAIIGILVAVALPQFASMTEDAKKTKAKQDCDTIAQAIQKYNSLEGAMVEKLMDLKGKYLTNIDTLKDPWGNAYQLDPYGGYVYSKGPDGQDKKDDQAHKTNKDNIKVPYIGALTIVSAKLEVNPNGETNPFWARDVLHLTFNKKVKCLGGFDMNAKSVPGSDTNLVPSDAHVAGKALDPAAAAGYQFRWCEGSRTKYVGGEAILRFSGENGTTGNIDNPGEPGGGAPITDQIDNNYAESDPKCFWAGTIPDDMCSQGDTAPTVTAGGIFHTDDSMEIVLVLPAGSSGSLIPGTHYINLTGNRKNTTTAHAIFTEFDGTTPGEMSGTPVRIEVYD